MIVVAAYVVVKAGKGPEFVEKAQECIQQTRKEEGNFSYTLFANTEADTKFTFFEEWETQAHLDKHMATAHFKALGGVLDALAAEPLVVKVYDATLAG